MDDDFYEGIFEDFKPKNLKGLGDFHLRSAIKSSSVESVKAHGRRRENLCLANLSTNLDGNICEGDPAELLSFVMKHYMNSKIEHKESSDCHERITIKKIILNRLQAEYDRDYCDSSEGFGRDRLIEAYRQFPDCSNHFHIQNAISIALVRMIAYGSDRKVPGDISEDVIGGESKLEGIFSIKLFGRRFVCTSDLFVVEDQTKRLSLFNIDVMRMIVDKITERNVIFVASSIGNIISPEIYPRWDCIYDIIVWGDSIISTFGNDGYKLLKAFEAIVLGVIMTLEEDIVINQSMFLNQTIQDLISDEPRFSYYIDRILYLLRNVNSIHHLTQIFGIYRIWGHPVINSSKGMKKVFNLGTEIKVISTVTAQRMGRIFKEQLYTSYFNKYRRYPNFELIEDIEVYLCQMLKGRKKINLYDGKYDLSHWDIVTTLKTFSIPETFNLSLVLADSAISPTLDELEKVASEDYNLMDPLIRRGVLKWLTKDIIDCEILLKEVNDQMIPSEELAIGLYPKEREINSTPRMFALMTLYIRCYIVVTEGLLSDDILPLFPQITMTDSMLELTKKIYSGSRRQGSNLRFEKIDNYTSAITICMNMDFEKWNLNMRRESTYYVFKELGLIYGLENLYNATYDIFEQSYIYLADGDYKLKLKHNKLKLSPPHSYIGHKGGFEGLRQKGWTLFTVVAIGSVLSNYKCSYKILGQGDNQVVLLTLSTTDIVESGFPTPRGIRYINNQLYTIKDDLIRTFSMLGLPLKPLETWESEKFFIYGKYPVYKGVPCSMSLKKICRIFPFSNDDIMTIDNVLGSIFSNGQAAAMSDINHYIPYLISLLKAAEGILWLLKYHPLSGQSPLYHKYKGGCLQLDSRWKMVSPTTNALVWHSCNTEMNIYQIVEMILIIPKSLGGFNGLTEYEFLMRGFPDNATRDYTYLSSIVNHYDGIIKVFIMNWLTLKLMTNQDFTLLLEDPTALNLYLPQSALPLLKSSIKLQMRESSSEYNKDFKHMISIDEEENKKLLVSYLTVSDNLYPRLLHDLYSSTLYGYVDSIISKIDKTVTIMRLSLSSSSIDLIAKLVEGEENFLKYFLWRCHQSNGLERVYCPTLQIKQARDLGWGKNCIGVTVPYPSHTLIWKHCNITEGFELDCPSYDYISVFYSMLVPKTLSGLCSTLGKSPPYLGSMTREKIGMKSKLTIQNTEPLLQRPFNLMRLINWVVKEDSNIAELIRNSILAITDLDPQQFASIPDASTGSADHRYNDSALKHGGLTASLYSLGSFLHMTTDTLESYARGSANVTLHFQALLCWTQHLASLLLWNNVYCQLPVPVFAHCHIRCSDCIVPVCEEIPDLSFRVPQDVIPSCKDCKYLYVRKEKVFIRDNTANAIAHLFPAISGINVADNLTENDIRKIVTEQLSLMILRDLSEEMIFDDHAQSTGLMEIGKYPRVLYLKVAVAEIFETLFHMMIVKELFRTIHLEDNWPTFESLRSKLLLRLNRIKLPNFLGLSMLFSWQNKRVEWTRISGSIFPTSYPMTFTSMCQAVKSNFINFILKTKQFPTVIYSNHILTLTKSDDLVKIIMFSNIYLKQQLRCGYCRYKATRLNFDSDENISASLSEQCIKGHYVYKEEEFLNIISTIDVSLDKLSKLIPDYKYVKTIKMKRRNIPTIPISAVLVTSSHGKLRYGKHPKDIIKDTWDRSNITDMQASLLEMTYKTYDNILYCAIDILISERTLFSLIEDKILVIGDNSGSISNFCVSHHPAKIYLLNNVDSASSFPQSFLESSPAEISEEMLLTGLISLIPSQYSSLSMLNDSLEQFLSMSKLYYNFPACISTLLCSDPAIEHFYGDMIERLAILKINVIFVLCEITSYKCGWKLMNALNKYYNTWKIKITPYCNLFQNQCWAVATGLRSTPLDKLINYQYAKSELETLRSFFSSPSKYNYSESYLFSINQLVMNSNRFEIMKSRLSIWLLDNNILPFWSNDKTFSTLLHDVQNNFSIKQMRILTSGSPIKHKLSLKVMNLAKKLLTIALSCLSTKEAIFKQVNSRRVWTITWELHPQANLYKSLKHKLYPVLTALEEKSDEFYIDVIENLCVMRNIIDFYQYQKFEELSRKAFFLFIIHGELVQSSSFSFNVTL